MNGSAEPATAVGPDAARYKGRYKARYFSNPDGVVVDAGRCNREEYKLHRRVVVTNGFFPDIWNRVAMSSENKPPCLRRFASATGTSGCRSRFHARILGSHFPGRCE